MKYGTSGFRDEANKILNISFKIGEFISHLILANNENYGIMITASHNKYDDNGVKIVDKNGNMIKKDYEILLEKYINNQYEILKIKDYFSPKKIFIGHDTRKSYYEIQNEIIRGIRNISSNILIVNLDFVTTPQHHYLVKYNFHNPNEYINKYKCVLNFDFNLDDLVIDCANGVGFLTLSKIKEYWNLDFELVNTKIYQHNFLNHESGSDYVINDMKLPYLSDKPYGCSIDGDADRFIFYYHDSKLNILDGDYIALLYLLVVNKKLEGDYSIGYIHTPYTNKAIIKYIKNLNEKINIKCTATGVKNLHHEALNYDISVYFESNGHGTILINNKELLNETFFKNISILNNEVVGDGISGIFCVKYFLSVLNLSFEEWYNLVNKNNFLLYKMEIENKDIFKTNLVGDRLIEPKELQDELDVIMQNNDSFCFVRPSGTENVIRIYIEGENIDIIKEKIDKLIINLK